MECTSQTDLKCKVCERAYTKVWVCDNANKKALFSIYAIQVQNARTILNKQHGCRFQMPLMEVDHVDEQEPSPIRGREQKPTTRNIIPANFVDQCDFSGLAALDEMLGLDVNY